VSSTGRFLLGAALLVGVALPATMVVTAGPASADPARPTHYQASVRGVVDAQGRPGSEGLGVAVDVLGGDAFLVVRVAPGTRVVVPGYEGEPYLQFHSDGRVEINQRSPARWLNQDRYGASASAIPASVDGAAPPVWEEVAAGGQYAWHDHRIHVMSPRLPMTVDPDLDTVQRVREASLPLLVDGQEVTVEIVLDWLPGRSPAVVGLVVLLVAVAVAAAVLAVPGLLVPVVTVTASAALGVGLATQLAVPPGGDGDPALVVLPTTTLVMLAAARWAARARPASARWLTFASVLPLTAWGMWSSPALFRPVVPEPLPAVAVCTVVVVAVAVAVAAIASALSGAVERAATPR
jgi:hypothetical protein